MHTDVPGSNAVAAPALPGGAAGTVGAARSAPAVPAVAAGPALFAPGAGKFVLMSLCTGSLYVTYWFYRNWRAIRDDSGERIMPVWRSIFSPLWAYSCFSRMQAIAEGRRRSLAIGPGPLAVAYFLLNLSARLPSPGFLFALLVFVPLLPLNSLARAHNRAHGLHQEGDDRYSGLNWLAIVVGGSMLTLVLIGIFAGPGAAYARYR